MSKLSHLVLTPYDVILVEGREATVRCYNCGRRVTVEETVWIDPTTTAATTGDSGRPYHVHCAPPQKE